MTRIEKYRFNLAAGALALAAAFASGSALADPYPVSGSLVISDLNLNPIASFGSNALTAGTGLLNGTADFYGGPNPAISLHPTLSGAGEVNATITLIYNFVITGEIPNEAIPIIFTPTASLSLAGDVVSGYPDSAIGIESANFSVVDDGHNEQASGVGSWLDSSMGSSQEMTGPQLSFFAHVGQVNTVTLNANVTLASLDPAGSGSGSVRLSQDISFDPSIDSSAYSIVYSLPVPEPASTLLAALGAVVLMGRTLIGRRQGCHRLPLV